MEAIERMSPSDTSYGSTTTHRVHGGTRAVHLQAWRAAAASLHAPKKTGPFEWTPEAECAFQNLKKYLSSLPVLVAPREGEELLLYISVTPQVVSAVVVAEREEKNPPEASGSEPGQRSPEPGTEGSRDMKIPAEYPRMNILEPRPTSPEPGARQPHDGEIPVETPGTLVPELGSEDLKPEPRTSGPKQDTDGARDHHLRAQG